jgi:hypothetical protein
MAESTPVVYEGGCHCGGVRFRVTVRRHEAIECNCSMCKKRASLHLIVPPEDFELLSGEELLTVYEFNTRVAKHRFCKRCGIHPFYTPRSHPDQIDVNVRCLDGDAVDAFEVGHFDGQNWEANVRSIR